MSGYVLDTNVGDTVEIAELSEPVTDGAIIIGDGTAPPTQLTAFTSSTGQLLHEQGGLEFDASAVLIGDFIAGTGTGTMALVPASGKSDGDVVTLQADGSLDFESVPPGGHLTRVGSAETYTDIQAAIDGGFSRLVLTSAVTEDSSIAVPAAGLYLDLNGYTLTMAANQFTWASTGVCTVVGDGQRSQIDYTQTSANEECFDDAGNGGIAILDNFTFDDNSGIRDTEIAIKTMEQHFSNLWIETPNLNRNGITSSNYLNTYHNIHFIGGGSGNFQVFLVALGGTASDITFSGTFSTSSAVMTVGAGQVVSNVMSFLDIAISLSGGVLSNLNSGTTARGISVSCIANGSILSDSFLGDGNVDLGSTDNCKLSSVRTTGTLDMSDASCNENQISNSEFGTTAVVFGGDDNQVTATTFGGLITTASGAVDNSFNDVKALGGMVINDRTTVIGGKYGALAGGGAGTITISAGTDSQIIGAKTDVDIVDNGTTTTLMGNRTY